MHELLTRQQERDARERADISEAGFYLTIVGLLMVAAFCAYMIFAP